MANAIKIGNRTVGMDSSPFVIAEMSGNHNQSLLKALAIVDAAADAGAHALKLQTYTADILTLDIAEGEFFIVAPDSPWKWVSLHKLYQQAYTPWEWHKPIFDRCNDRGLLCFSTPFDETAIDFLESLNVPCYKIASFENIHLPLIRKAAATGKPLIISTGLASLAELDDAVKTAHDAGCKDIILLKCTSTYPATAENTNILTIPHLRDMFGVQVGLSDHTMGIGVAIAAVAHGATVIEKHFTLSRADGGVDASFSIEPDELKSLVVETERAWMSLGKVTYELTENEKASMQFRRSLYVTQDMGAGDLFTPQNMRVIRPGFGLPPKFFEILLGRNVKRDVKKGTPVTWDLL